MADPEPGRVHADGGVGHQPWLPVASVPEVSPSMPEASTNGRSESTSAAPMASTARRSAAAAAAKLPPKAELVLEGQVNHAV